MKFGYTTALNLFDVVPTSYQSPKKTSYVANSTNSSLPRRFNLPSLLGLPLCSLPEKLTDLFAFVLTTAG